MAIKKFGSIILVAKGPATCKMEKDTWMIHDYINPSDTVEIKEGTMKNTLLMSNCQNTTLRVHPKINSIMIDGCVGCKIIIDNLVSSLEVVDCTSMYIQILGRAPTISLDKTNGVSLYVSKENKDCDIYTSKSSEMNICIPKAEEGDWKELPIPEQFLSKYDEKSGKLTTKVSPLYG